MSCLNPMGFEISSEFFHQRYTALFLLLLLLLFVSFFFFPLSFSYFPLCVCVCAQLNWGLLRPMIEIILFGFHCWTHDANVVSAIVYAKIAHPKISVKLPTQWHRCQSIGADFSDRIWLECFSSDKEFVSSSNPFTIDEINDVISKHEQHIQMALKQNENANKLSEMK